MLRHIFILPKIKELFSLHAINFLIICVCSSLNIDNNSKPKHRKETASFLDLYIITEFFSSPLTTCLIIERMCKNLLTRYDIHLSVLDLNEELSFLKVYLISFCRTYFLFIVGR